MEEEGWRKPACHAPVFTVTTTVLAVLPGVTVVGVKMHEPTVGNPVHQKLIALGKVPLGVTVRLIVPDAPSLRVIVDEVVARLKSATAVVSDAVLFVRLESKPPPDTVAEFTREPGAPLLTFTVRVIAG